MTSIMEVANDDEYEEQEVLVYVDFASKIDDDLLSLEKEFKLIGLESESPVLQLGNQVFQGEWKDSLGTQVLFDTDPGPPKTDPLFSETPSNYVRYSCQADKILYMSRIFVNSKKETEAAGEEPSVDQGAQKSGEES